jgi:hypothetical protein
VQESRKLRRADEAGAGSGASEEYGYRKTVDVGGIQGYLRDFPRSPIGRFGIIATAGVGGQTALANQMQCPILTLETGTFATFKVLPEDFVEAAMQTLPLMSDAKQIALLGPSGGGYVALALGMTFSRLRPSLPIRVVCFNPPTKIWPVEPTRMNMPLYREMMEGAESNPAVRARLEERGDAAKLLQEFWQDVPDADFRALLIGSMYHDRDAWHIQRVEGMPNIHTLMLETDAHTVHRMMTTPLNTIEGKTQFAKNLYKFDPEGMQIKSSISPAEASDAMRVTLELRARFPTVRAMFDWLDAQPADNPASAGPASAGAALPAAS